MDNSNTNPAQNLEIPADIRKFLEGILQDANMTSLDETMREEMVKELYARLDSYLTSTIVRNLPPENLEEFTRMNEQKRPQPEIEQYLKDHLPNSQEVLSQAFMEFRELYLGNVGVARSAPAQS